MTCPGCRFLGQNCGGLEGLPPVPTVDPMSLSSKQLVDLACALARVGTLICDIGQPMKGSLSAGAGETPYIWDIKED